jgi:hypothetical protein
MRADRRKRAFAFDNERPATLQKTLKKSIGVTAREGCDGSP